MKERGGGRIGVITEKKPVKMIVTKKDICRKQGRFNASFFNSTFRFN